MRTEYAPPPSYYELGLFSPQEGNNENEIPTSQDFGDLSDSDIQDRLCAVDPSTELIPKLMAIKQLLINSGVKRVS